MLCIVLFVPVPVVAGETYSVENNQAELSTENISTKSCAHTKVKVLSNIDHETCFKLIGTYIILCVDCNRQMESGVISIDKNPPEHNASAWKTYSCNGYEHIYYKYCRKCSAQLEKFSRVDYGNCIEFNSLDTAADAYRSLD